ncbi:MAG: glycosyltransferase family 9 protein [Acidobacteriaceae bacterium]
MPDAIIIVATRGTGQQTLQHNPYIDHLLCTSDPLTQTWKTARELKQQLKQRGLAPQYLITNSANQRTRIALLSMLLGRHIRIGFTLAPEFYDVPLKYDWSKSLIDNTLRLIEPAGYEPVHVEPRVYFTAKDTEKARLLLEEYHLLDGKPLLVMVTQNSGGQRTGWHTDRFVQVIHHVSENLGCHVIFVGTQADESAIHSLRSSAKGQGISLAGKTNISELAALLCMSDYAISVDTGTMHVARAAGLPMVVLGPSWQRPLEWLPLGIENIRILRGEDIDYVPENYHLDEIEAEAVIQAINELYACYPANAKQREIRVERCLIL